LLASAVAALAGVLSTGVAFGLDRLSTGVTGYNHTDQEITWTVNNQAGGYTFPHTGGGKTSCCVSLPAKWRPGTKVVVSWVVGTGTKMTDTEVQVPRYQTDQVGGLNVHFLRDGSIRVFATMLDLRHPDYPLKGEAAQLKAGVELKGQR
jgi:hypothetical protein